MRRTLVSALLLSSMFLPAAANASPRTDDASASTLRVSTGITPPRLLNSLVVGTSDVLNPTPLPVNASFSVAFTVDANGQPRDIQVLKGQNLAWDARIVNAVRNLHYAPATMDHQPVSMGVVLIVNLNR